MDAQLKIEYICDNCKRHHNECDTNIICNTCYNTQDSSVKDYSTLKINYYKLCENKSVIPCNFEEWKDFNISENRIVSQTDVNNLLVSTVFLGIDHGYHDNEFHVFETMIFKYLYDDVLSYVLSDSEDYCERYATYKEAIEGHQRAIEWVKNNYPNV